MSEPTKPTTDGDGAAARIRDVINDCRQRRVAGEPIADDVLIAAHPELMPELGEELRKLRLIAAAREQAARRMGVGVETVSRDGSVTADSSDDAAVSTGGQGNDRTMPHRASLDIAQLAAAGKLPTRFKVQSVLGKGGFGAVYLAYDELLQREVALKMPCVEGLAESELKQFVEEARTLARLKHPGIVSIYDVQITEGNGVSLIMEYLSGSSLEDRIKQRPTPREEAIDAVIKIAEAIQYAHEQGFVHRDLKPSNVLFDRDGQPRVADFGLAIHETNQRKHAGELSGTLPYMSPEQVRGETHRLDGRTDIWSIGVILYELLTGRRPFDGDTRDEICGEILNREPKPLRQIDRSIPADLDETCLKCLSKPVTGRFQTAGDLADRLRKSLSATAAPIGAPTGASLLPFRQFIAKANIGRLGCGLTVTLASLLCVASLISIRSGMWSSKPTLAVTRAEVVLPSKNTALVDASLAKHDEPAGPPIAANNPSMPESVELPATGRFYAHSPTATSTLETTHDGTPTILDIQGYPYVPSSGGATITASDTKAYERYWAANAQPIRSSYKYLASQQAALIRDQQAALIRDWYVGNALLNRQPAILCAFSMMPFIAGGNWPGALQVPVWIAQKHPFGPSNRDPEFPEWQRQLQLDALLRKKSFNQVQEKPLYRLSSEEFDRKTGSINWPRALRSPEYDALRSQLESAFKERASAPVNESTTAQIIRSADQLMRELRKDISHVDQREYLIAAKFIIGLKYETANKPPGATNNPNAPAK